MEQRKAKVLVVDDSSFLRKLMVRLMAENPAIEVVGEARNGKEALASGFGCTEPARKKEGTGGVGALAPGVQDQRERGEGMA